MDPTISAFIISWSGQTANAEVIENGLADHVERLTVIHSDQHQSPGLRGGRWRGVPNDWFYGRKFRRCLEEFDGDIMLQVTADVTCADWALLVHRCRECFREVGNLGVWAPIVDHTPWALDRTGIARLGQSPIHFVTMVDSIVWAISSDVIDRLRGLNYECNNLGWGIERIAALYCHSNNKTVAIDSSLNMIHKPGRGYSSDEAMAQYGQFIRQATLTEQIHDVLISRYMGPRAS